jgi:LysM repeat protein
VSHIDLILSRPRLVIELLIATVVVIPFIARAGFFSDWFAPDLVSVKNSPIEIVDVSTIALLSAQQNPDPIGGRGGAELIVDENALVSTGPVGENEIADNSSSNGEIRVYTVREGDSLSQVAEMFDVTTNTIMWANDISRASGIQPGQTLVILPIAGVRHVIKSGDTISTIAKKYEGDADEILEYNQLASAGDLVVGETIIIPGGAMHATPVKTAKQSSSGGSSSSYNSGGSTGSFSHPAPGAMRSQGIHGYNAVDLAGSYGSAIRSAADGQVIVAKASGWNGGYGSYIVVKHNNGTQTLYAHLSSVQVGVGQYVGQGETIAGMGNSGKSTGTHLHFEVRGGRNPF